MLAPINNSADALRNSSYISDSLNDARTKTGWWSYITGGKKEKEASVAQADYANAFSANQAKIQRDFASIEAQKQRDYEERLSNTAYTRAYQDMKNAGLNPALMYAKGGMEASTPAGASASVGSAPQGRTPDNPSSSTGQLASIIASVAFSSAKVATTAMGIKSAEKMTKMYGYRK